MKDFRKLKVWILAHDLTKRIYKITDGFPKAEIYGLISQLRRASVSIATNIVEGSSRGSDADFSRFVQIAIGSASEVEYLLLLSKDLSLISNPDYEQLDFDVNTLKRMLITLLKKLKA